MMRPTCGRNANGGTMTIQDVMARHGTAIREGDVDGVLADYAEDSVIMSPGRTVRGLAEIRDLFADLFTNLIPPGLSKLEATWSAMEGEYVFVVWKGESERHSFPVGTDTFVVRDDKIVFQTFVPHTVDK
jgi:Fe-S cluster assembly scaffold protein SufB